MSANRVGVGTREGVAGMFCLAFVALGVGPAWSQDDPTTALSGVVVTAKPSATPLSELVVTAKPQVTPLSELVVAAKPKAAPLAGLDVSPAKVCKGARHPPDPTIPPPRLVSTFPAEGAVVRPGLLILRLTFDMPMSCDGIFLASPMLEKPCWQEPRQDLVLTFDRRTIRMACIVAENTRYGLRMNYSPGADALPREKGHPITFASLAGWPAKPFELTFSTSSEVAVTTLEDAVAEDADSPAFHAAVASAAVEPTPVSQPGQSEVSGVAVRPPARCLGPRRPPDAQIPHPKIVGSFPAPGAIVRPGLTVLRFTFDLPMSCQGMVQQIALLPAPCPRRVQDLMLTFDRRTIRIVCHTEPNAQYGVAINPSKRAQFVGLGGWASDPYELTFATSGAAPVTDVYDALGEDIEGVQDAPLDRLSAAALAGLSPGQGHGAPGG